MLIAQLMRYVQLAVKRRGAVEVALSAWIAVLVLSMGLLIIKVTEDAEPREELHLALLR